MQNISRPQGINRFHGFDSELTIVLGSTVEDGTLITGDHPVSDALASQICHNALLFIDASFVDQHHLSNF